MSYETPGQLAQHSKGATVVQAGFRVQEISEYLSLVEIYGRGCIRLVRILKSQENLQDGAERRVREVIRIAARQVLEEKRLEALS